MWQFVLGLFVGANIGLVLFSLINVAGRREDKDDN